ncbi:MAG: HD domain-containing protein [Cyclobacteriaceae bacterium]|nr:HD domain-containing protein [Cyclobacteriaceae bacterium]
MPDFKNILSSSEIFKAVEEAAEKIGVNAYVVGGYVRDLLLGKEAKDIDFVCVGSGVALAKATASLLGVSSGLAIFKNFGTAMFRYGEYELEFIGARKESYDRTSRKPTVEDGSMEDDQKRRDFTINALAIGLNGKDKSQLIDPFGGIEDLRRGIIRTPLDPEITFSDDPLRMLRAIRFAGRLKFDIEPTTFHAIMDHKDRMEIVSAERISDELNKMIMADEPSYGFKLLFHSGLLATFFPEMVKLHGVDTRAGKSHKDNFYHTLEVLDNVAKVSKDNLWLRWAAILHDIAKPATKRFHPKAGWTFHGHEDKGARMVAPIFKRLKLPLGDKMKYVRKLVRLHLRPIALVKSNITDSAIRRLLFEAGDDIHDLMILCRADITSKNHNRVQRYLANFDYVESKMEQVEEKDKVRNFQPPVTGEDIMKTFDITPSPVIGEFKEAIKEAILEGQIQNNFEEAYVLLLKLAEKRSMNVITNLLGK